MPDFLYNIPKWVCQNGWMYQITAKYTNWPLNTNTFHFKAFPNIPKFFVFLVGMNIHRLATFFNRAMDMSKNFNICCSTWLLKIINVLYFYVKMFCSVFSCLCNYGSYFVFWRFNGLKIGQWPSSIPELAFPHWNRAVSVSVIARRLKMQSILLIRHFFGRKLGQ
jgi:hypothetical protein